MRCWSATCATCWPRRASPCRCATWCWAAERELPLGECEPEVWVAAHDRERAEALIHASMTGTTGAPDWHCPGCGEALEGTFDACWRCGATRA
ncbi:hypothetical protein [Halomonas sp. E19]|uniref:hypothetical protein n=1 Tax=Halomonas sp. E19 TaxID=3397247 RepID=UPI0040339B5B